LTLPSTLIGEAEEESERNMSSAREYLQMQGVEEKIADAVKQVIVDQPTDAVKRIGELLVAGKSPCYMVVRTTPSDMAKFGAYGAKAGELATNFGGQLLTFNACTAIEGPLAGPMGGPVMGVVRWPDKATAEKWYNSPENQAIIPDRLASTTDETTFTLAPLMNEPVGPPGTKVYQSIRVNPHPQGKARFNDYMSKAGPLGAKYGSNILAFGPASTLEGQVGMPMLAVVEWPDEATFKAWYDSPEYQAIIPDRLAGTYGETTFAIATGFVG